MSWEDKPQVKKGNIGENIIRGYLESKGWVVYEPITDRAHGFDKLCMMGKRQLIISEVKTKARLNKLNATGFNLRHFEEYKYIRNKHGIEVFIFFVDEHLKKIYGNKLSVLEKPYKAKDGDYPKLIANDKIIIFSLEVMHYVSNLSEGESNEIKKYNTRSYDYETVGVA